MLGVARVQVFLDPSLFDIGKCRGRELFVEGCNMWVWLLYVDLVIPCHLWRGILLDAG